MFAKTTTKTLWKNAPWTDEPNCPQHPAQRPCPKCGAGMSTTAWVIEYRKEMRFKTVPARVRPSKDDPIPNLQDHEYLKLTCRVCGYSQEAPTIEQWRLQHVGQ